MEGMKRILIVEDDSHIADLLALHLRDEGYHIEHAADGAERLTTAFTQQRLHRLLGNLAFIVDSIKQDGFFNLAQERGIQFHNVIPPSS